MNVLDILENSSLQIMARMLLENIDAAADGTLDIDDDETAKDVFMRDLSLMVQELQEVLEELSQV